ncbi:hypothetical protein F443_18427, partial [Phytophthora nicotianae P1569]
PHTSATESPFNVSAFTEEPMSVETHQPKKKRIRRVKQELDYLRRESKDWRMNWPNCIQFRQTGPLARFLSGLE